MKVWMTALQAIHLVGEYNSRTVKSILWHAGASAVSIAGLQLSLALSDPPPRVYATTRQDAKCDFVVDQIGAQAAVNTTKSYNKADGSPDGTWADEIRRINNGEGIDLIIDFIGGPYFASNLSLLAQDGRLVLLGAMGGMTIPGEVDISPILMKRATVVGSTLRSRDAEYQGRLRDLFVEKVLPGLVSGEFRVVVERVCSWNDVGMAHGLLESNETRGKVVCLVD
jgi:NADPH:quinone reductase-like Zn-dependent oxidoreductase